MILDLTNEELFEDKELNLNKKITFAFGKNGTGKSTLAKIIKQQCREYDVRVFDGFEHIVGESRRLNAVVLGEENTLIRQQIKKIEDNIQILNEKKETIRRETEQPEDDTITNYWTRNRDAMKQFDDKEQSIKKFYTKAASEIKKQNNPQISSTSYDARAFQRDIQYALLLTEDEKKQCIEILKSDPKIANNISFPVMDLETLFDEVNAILCHSVTERVKISRLEGDNDKRDFAYKGYKIHAKGDVCAFCGSSINESVFNELESYFSADEVKEFRAKINEKIECILRFRNIVECLEINEKDFYPQFVDEVLQLKKLIFEKKNDYCSFFEKLENALKEKLAYLFESVETISINIPEDFSILCERYNEIKSQNNEDNLAEKQKNAKEKLRIHAVKEQLEKFRYESIMSELSILIEQKDKMNQELHNEILKVIGEGGLDSQISELRDKIVVLQNSTKNEKILAHNINKKLRNMVSFELVHCENEDEKGYYAVKNIYTNRMRDITQLSTGEKNIIAFLYFVEKLDEIKEEGTELKRKVIVFDDPMNSNDDNMQYLIIEELQRLMDRIQNDDRFILLSHNIHFYLNVKYKHNSYKKNMFLRLQTDGYKSKFKILTEEDEDFNTSYEALWKEMIFLYNNVESPEMLLNPMRRIIETYTNFNGINKNDFCEKKSGAMKLFNVNSHSIDDLEADLCGKSKEEIVNLFCECFYENRALLHFKNHWKAYDTSFLGE